MRRGARAIGTVVDLELKQRVRSTAWYVLLGVFAGLLLLVTALLLATFRAIGGEGGEAAFSTVVYFVLLLGSLVTPALSGGVVNGDRDAGTLATTQVTLVTTAQLLLGKFLAAWIASLAFLAVAVPFLLVAVVAARVPIDVIAVSLLVTALELGVLAAIGVGLSSLLARPVFSVVTTYLVVAALSIGTVIAFSLGGLVSLSRVTTVDESYAEGSVDAKGDPLPGAVCTTEVSTSMQPRYDTVWWLLAANPYVVLADAVPSHWNRDGDPVNAFDGVKLGVRSAQIPPRSREVYSECHPSRNTDEARPARDIVASTVPSWFVGLGIHLLLGAGFLVLGGLALRTPARRLARGSRIA